VSRGSRRGYALGFYGWHESGNELRAGDLAPVSCVMLGCRAPIPSKDKQQIGTVFCGIRSIETQTAVNARMVSLTRVGAQQFKRTKSWMGEGRVSVTRTSKLFHPKDPDDAVLVPCACYSVPIPSAKKL
jgi:hypothetical protein